MNYIYKFPVSPEVDVRIPLPIYGLIVFLCSYISWFTISISQKKFNLDLFNFFKIREIGVHTNVSSESVLFCYIAFALYCATSSQRSHGCTITTSSWLQFLIFSITSKTPSPGVRYLYINTFVDSSGGYNSN